MTKNTKIEWAHHTFNPWIGCTAVSPACDHCYAENMMDTRLKVVKWGAGQERKRTSQSNWQQPLKWDAEAKKLGVRHRVFCASLADVFDNEVPAQWREQLFDLIYVTPNLDWLLLTKRIGNAASMLPNFGGKHNPMNWRTGWKNVWIGATICNQEEADRDIPKLLQVPAAKRFLSIEPLLGAVDLTRVVYPLFKQKDENDPYIAYDTLRGHMIGPDDIELPKLDWVIVGGESGNQARPMHPEWVRSLRDQCTTADVPFLFKQWGEWEVASVENGHHDCDMTRNSAIWLDHDGTTASPSSSGLSDHAYAMMKVGKKAAGRLLDGREWNEVPL